MNETQSSPGGWVPHNRTWTTTEGRVGWQELRWVCPLGRASGARTASWRRSLSWPDGKSVPASIHKTPCTPSTPHCSLRAWMVPGTSCLQALPLLLGESFWSVPATPHTSFKILSVRVDLPVPSSGDWRHGCSSPGRPRDQEWELYQVPRALNALALSTAGAQSLALNCRAEVQSILFTCQPLTALVIAFTDTESRPLQAPEVTPFYGVCKSSVL